MMRLTGAWACWVPNLEPEGHSDAGADELYYAGMCISALLALLTVGTYLCLACATGPSNVEKNGAG